MLADEDELADGADDGALFGVADEQPTRSSGNVDRAANPRNENGRLAIRTCCHGRRRRPTAVRRVLG